MLKKFLPVFFIVILGFLSCEKDSLEENLVQPSNSVIEKEILNLVNSHRSSIGKEMLLNSNVAKEYADEHSLYMVGKGKISHDNFPIRAENISQKTNASFIAENVAKDFTTASQTFSKWLESSGHKQNIEGDFTHTGVSVKADEDGNFYFTQIFYK